MTYEPARRAQRITVILHDFYPGGAERIAITLANRWRAMDRDVAILCGSEAGPFRGRVHAGVPVASVQPPIPQGRFSRIRLGFACAGVLQRSPPDLVFAPGNFHLPIVGIAARARYRQRPVFVCKLSNRLCRPSRRWLAQRIFNVTTRIWGHRLDGFSVMSPNLGEDARKVLRTGAIECIWEPCLTTDGAVPMHARARKGVVRIVVAGRLVPEKDVSLALRTLAVVARKGGASMQIVGDGPLRLRLEAEARALGIADCVRFTGHVPDISPFLADADVLLSTSRYEGYPAVLIEALAAGVPVVATNSSPAVPEILFDPSFGTIAAATPDALARAIAVASGAHPAPDAMERLVSRHRAAHSAKAYLDWFDRLIMRSAHRHGVSSGGAE